MPRGHRKKRPIWLWAILFLILFFTVSGLTAHHFAPGWVDQKFRQLTNQPLSKAETKKQLTADWNQKLNTTQSAVSIAVYDRRHDQVIETTNANAGTFLTASTVKVAILAQILRQHQVDGTQLSAAEKQYAVPMIEKSDDDAASYMYVHYLGYAEGLQRLFSNLGMNATQISETGWTLTQTTARDQLKLLNAIFYQKNYLSANSRAYLKNLMAHVTPSQQWGISAAGGQFQIKNGWRQWDDGTWTVNSMGHLGTGKNSCTIAIFTYNNKSFAAGKKLIESLAKTTGETLQLSDG